MPIKNPTLHKVFIALRTDFFPDFHREHVTLKYFNSIQWNVLLEECSRLENQLPAEIHPLYYSTWQGFDARWYDGLIVDAPGSTVLDHLSMPHITVPLSLTNRVTVQELYPQVVDTLWIGKSIKGRYIWGKYDSRPIGASYEHTHS